MSHIATVQVTFVIQVGNLHLLSSMMFINKLFNVQQGKHCFLRHCQYYSNLDNINSPTTINES